MILNSIPKPRFESTPLKKDAYGKTESSRGNLSFQAHLQLHKPAQANEIKVRIYPSLAQNGTISFHSMVRFNLTDSRATNAVNASKPLFVSVSLDPREYTNRTGRTIYNDSNREMISKVIKEKSSWNSIIVKGSVASLLIPFDSNWDNDKHNAHALKLMESLMKIEELNVSEAEATEAYTKAWNDYEKVEKILVDKGFLARSNVIIAEESGVIPNLSLSQVSSYKSEEFTGKKQVGNEGQLATFVPILNDINGIFKFTDQTQDPNNEYEYGLREMQQSADSSRVIKTFSSELVSFDFLNKENNQSVMSIALSDLPYETQRSRAELFEQFKSEHTYLEVKKGRLSLRNSLGGYTSTFHISGEDLTYSPYVMKGLEAYEVNEDDFDLSEAEEDMSALVESDEF